MTLKPVPVFLGVLAVIGGLTHSAVAGIILGAVAVAIVWWRDVRRNPGVSCRACKGSGMNPSPFWGFGPFRRPAGSCSRCGGKKGFPRMALRMVNPDARRKMLADIARGKQGIGK